jgi:hypothetical protein
MGKIDEIMRAATELGDLRIMAANGRQSPGEISDATDELRDLITTAIADARREGEEQMRERAAVAAWSSGLDQHNHWRGSPISARDAGSVCAQAIRALPLDL